ncbi:MAG TPA: hypothetical protein V6D22_10750 [Candidatus Obscuribacterales bacterium]
MTDIPQFIGRRPTASGYLSVFLLAMSVLGTATPAQSASSTSPLIQYDNLEQGVVHTLRPRGKPVWRSTHCPVQTPDGIRPFVLKYFDPTLLSNPAARVSMEVFADKLGRVSYKEIGCDQCTDSDRFYCEQAIWEAAPIVPYEGSGTDIKWDDKITFQATTPVEQSPKIAMEDGMKVKMHFVPASVTDLFPYVFSKQQLSDASNIVNISVEKRESPRLQEFRKEWVLFILTHADTTPEEFSAHVASMRKKYHDLFDTQAGKVIREPNR